MKHLRSSRPNPYARSVRRKIGVRPALVIAALLAAGVMPASDAHAESSEPVVGRFDVAASIGAMLFRYPHEFYSALLEVRALIKKCDQILESKISDAEKSHVFEGQLNLAHDWLARNAAYVDANLVDFISARIRASRKDLLVLSRSSDRERRARASDRLHSEVRWASIFTMGFL